MRKPSQKSEAMRNGAANAAAMTAPVTAARNMADSGPAAEQAGRPEEQHGDEDQGNADLAERLAEKQAAQGLGDADDEAAQQRARKTAHAAEDDHGKGHENEDVADGGRDVECGQKKACGRAEAGGSDAEAHGED